MTTVLVIAADDALRAAWTEAARTLGMQVRAVAAMLPAVDLLGTTPIDGMLVDARGDGELELLAAVSVYRPMPPTVIVHDREVAIPARLRAGACRPTTTSAAELVALLASLLEQRELTRPTNLPLRVMSIALKWTSRLSAPSEHDDSEDVRRQFDGETGPDGFDLAAG